MTDVISQSEMFDALLALAAQGLWATALPLAQAAVLVLVWMLFAAWEMTRLLVAGLILYLGNQIILAWARAFVASLRPRS